MVDLVITVENLNCKYDVIKSLIHENSFIHFLLMLQLLEIHKT